MLKKVSFLFFLLSMMFGGFITFFLMCNISKTWSDRRHYSCSSALRSVSLEKADIMRVQCFQLKPNDGGLSTAPGTKQSPPKRRIVLYNFAVSHSLFISAVNSLYRYVWRFDVMRETGVPEGRRASRYASAQLKSTLHHFRLTFRRGCSL